MVVVVQVVEAHGFEFVCGFIGSGASDSVLPFCVFWHPCPRDRQAQEGICSRNGLLPDCGRRRGRHQFLDATRAFGVMHFQAVVVNKVFGSVSQLVDSGNIAFNNFWACSESPDGGKVSLRRISGMWYSDAWEIPTAM